MKLRKLLVWALAATLSTLGVGCTNDVDEGMESGYGYAQFKLYKHASYNPEGRALVGGELEYLRDAYKVQVTLGYDEGYERTITQTLTLANDGSVAGEWGLRSDKIKLLVGAYKLHSFTLYDAEDELLSSFSPTIDSHFEVVEGGLTVQDITVNAIQRGLVRFTLVKDLSGLNKAASNRDREYTLDEIKKANVTLKN